MIGHRADDTGLSFVDVDIEPGVGLAVDHLAGLGHREIALLTVDPVVQDKTYGFGTWALRGSQAACQRITAIDLPADELGRIAARMMLDLLDGGKTHAGAAPAAPAPDRARQYPGSADTTRDTAVEAPQWARSMMYSTSPSSAPGMSSPQSAVNERRRRMPRRSMTARDRVLTVMV